MKNNQDYLNLLRKIKNKPESSQRELAVELGFSLGKLNYCLKALKSKGLIKIANFRQNPNKINYIYVLTPKGIAEKLKIGTLQTGATAIDFNLSQMKPSPQIGTQKGCRAQQLWKTGAT